MLSAMSEAFWYARFASMAPKALSPGVWISSSAVAPPQDAVRAVLLVGAPHAVERRQVAVGAGHDVRLSHGRTSGWRSLRAIEAKVSSV